MMTTNNRFTEVEDNGDGNGNGYRPPNRWRVAKDIPLALIIAILVQTAGGIWWMAQTTSKIDYLISAQTEFRAERYTREDARRDRELLEQKFVLGSNINHEFDRRINSVESRLDRLEGRISK